MTPRTITINALLIALATVATMTIRLPTPATQGYLNLGDSVIFAAALLFGPRTGGLVGGIGSALADLLGGYPHWVPFTLFIKGLEGVLVGIVFRGSLHTYRGILLGGASAILGGLWMVAGYFLSETFLYGWQPALSGLPGNSMQALVGLLIGLPVAMALSRAGIGPKSQ